MKSMGRLLVTSLLITMVTLIIVNQPKSVPDASKSLHPISRLHILTNTHNINGGACDCEKIGNSCEDPCTAYACDPQGTVESLTCNQGGKCVGEGTKNCGETQDGVCWVKKTCTTDCETGCVTQDGPAKTKATLSSC